ncbi:hypothetical protein BGZ96_011549 [Linnemannia gamsii]|uniref:ATP-dependent DNA ligase family profile domain-containing protein n=1 Tax=Linnemannia gamsii TaxID=64522 RepID=A0ABQ7JSK3_9FUNG|nr:hypothetical protein BGZ96_011549 [Linnemannia gamsii]
MFTRTCTVCARCLRRSPSLLIGAGAGKTRSGGSALRSHSTSPRSATVHSQLRTSPLVGFNINNAHIHRNSNLRRPHASCRSLSASATSPKGSTIKQPSSPAPAPAPAPTRKKSSRSKPSSAIITQPSTSSTLDKIPDFKFSKTKPCEDLDGLQVLVDKLISTNATLSKRGILIQHPEQAPLLAWIYDPQRQFYVRPAGLIKFAQRWANQQDEALAAAKAAVIGGSSTLDSGAGPGSLSSKEHLLGEDMSATTTKPMSSSSKSKAVQSIGQEFETLSSLLGAISSRSITGHASMDAILSFMDRYCGPGSGSSFKPLDSITTPNGSYSRAMVTLLSTPRSKLLLKVLDKNLKAGCGIALIREAFPTLLPGFHVALGKHMPLESATELFELKPATEKKTKSKKLTKESTATTLDPNLSNLPNTVNTEWLGSRKLDGVRCLVRIDRQTGNITTLSRNGREFEGTSKIQDSFRSIMRMVTQSHSHGDGDEEAQGRDEFFRQALGLQGKDGSALPEALVLDGEMCVFMAEPVQEQPIVSKSSQSSSSSPIMVGFLDEDGLGKEQFTKAITFVTTGAIENSIDTDDDDDDLPKDKPTTLAAGIGSKELNLEYDRPIYCIFDCLTEKEFKDREGVRPLLDRIRGVTQALIQSKGVQDSGVLVKVLSQSKVESFEQLKNMVSQGVERGWEGVVLRKNIGYEGRRSRNLLKFKEFQEAEFVVEEATLGTMRLPLNGQYEERYCLTSVIVGHRGNRVGVGSGFSAEERIRFGKDPSLIVGKTITVKYFEESKTYSSPGTGSSGSSGSDDEAFLGNDRVYRSPSRVSSASSSSIDQRAADDDNGNDRDGSEDKGDDRDAVWSLRFPIVKAIYGEGPREL